MRRLAGALLALASLAAAGCGGGEEPPSTVAAGGPILGFNEGITAATANDELLADSGAGFVRVALGWASVEPQEGRRDWSGPDALDAGLAEIGLRPLWVVTSAPCWAAARPCSIPEPSVAPSPAHLDDYAAFAAAVAERYPDALGIEVWNEPNIPNFWRPAPDAAAYRELLSQAADAIHRSGSEVPVVMAGPSPTSPEQAAVDPLKIPFVEFIEEVMAGPDAPDVDAIATHPYSLLQRAADPSGESIRIFEEARDAARRVAPETPIWVTEIGLTTAGRYAVSAEDQATGLVEIFEALVAADVPVIAVHRFFDQLDPPLQFEAGFGVIAADGTPKPAYCALAEQAGVDCRT